MSNRVRMILHIISIVIALLGCGLIVLYGSWQLLLGVFLLTWGNNVGQRAGTNNKEV